MENQSIVQSVDAGSLQSRWGHHPCNRDTFLKLKAIHKAFWWHVRRSVAAERWEAKRPENRRGKCPEFFRPFYVSKCWGMYIDKNGSQTSGMLRKVNDEPVRVLFQLARMPSAKPVKAFDAATLKQIDDWCDALAKWEQEQAAK